MKAHSMEIRKCVNRAMEKGELTQEEVAELLGVSSRWVRWLYQRWPTTSKLEPLPHGGGYPLKITTAVELQLRKYLEEHPDETLAESQMDCGLSVILSASCQSLQRLGLCRKTNVVFASEREQPEVQAKHLTWKHRTCQIDAHRIASVDQTGVNTRVQRDHGRAPAGVRVVGVVRDKHYQS